MDIRFNPAWSAARLSAGFENSPSSYSLGGGAQAASLWRSGPRGANRPPGAPSRAILARAEEAYAMLDRLKGDVHEDNATKSARLSLLV